MSFRTAIRWTVNCRTTHYQTANRPKTTRETIPTRSRTKTICWIRSRSCGCGLCSRIRAIDEPLVRFELYSCPVGEPPVEEAATDAGESNRESEVPVHLLGEPDTDAISIDSHAGQHGQVRIMAACLQRSWLAHFDVFRVQWQ